MASFGSFSAQGRDMGLVAPIWVFLARGRFAAKAPAHEGWILLDFLGFSRPNRYFSMGYAAFSRKIFSRAPFRGVRSAETGDPSLGMPKLRIVHRASLT
jgi:hypothetical protein